MTKRRLLLIISLLLAAYTLGISRFLPSGLFFIVAICWVSFGSSVFFGRLEAAKAMAMSMITILVIAGIICSVIPFGQTDTRAQMLLGFFPIVISWAGVYFYILHLQSVGDESTNLLDA